MKLTCHPCLIAKTYYSYALKTTNQGVYLNKVWSCTEFARLLHKICILSFLDKWMSYYSVLFLKSTGSLNQNQCRTCMDLLYIGWTLGFGSCSKATQKLLKSCPKAAQAAWNLPKICPSCPRATQKNFWKKIIEKEMKKKFEKKNFEKKIEKKKN